MADEYYRRGTSKVVWLATKPVSLSAPTQAEITAGINLSAQLAGVDGFMSKTTFVDVENMASRTTTSLAGPNKADGGTLTFNEKKNAAGATPSSYDPIMAALTQDATGYLMIAPYGSATGNDAEIWHCQVGSFSRDMGMTNTVAKYKIELGALDPPTQHATIAA